MPKELTLDQTYDQCISGGNIILQDFIDDNRINSMIKIATDDLESAKSLIKNKDPRWGSIYKLYYDVIHQLAETLLLLDKVKSQNHQCLFSYLCIKHPELELDWNFFEKIRTKRNGIHYYGNMIAKRDWAEIEFQINLYIKTLFEAIENKIKIFSI